MRTAARAAASSAAAFSIAAVLLHATAAAQPLPIFDAHVHYSHDAWDVVPTADVIALMRKAGLRHALVSSSNDEGTQRLYAAAPELVIPSLRPYRSRGELSTWARDESVARHVEERLGRHRYAAIGEFHLYGADADLAVPRRIVELAKSHRLILHAHSDADAIERIFRQDPGARVLWAHAGFDRPQAVREMLRRHPGLRADLAYRSDMGSSSGVDPDWLEAFREFPDRFMVGTDTFTPERLHYIPVHAEYSRGWLAALPPALAEGIAWRNAEAFIVPVWAASRARPPAGSARAGCAAIAALGERAERVESAGVLLAYRVRPVPVAVGQPFSIDIAACARDAAGAVASIALDAVMPEHRHGMNYAPRISATEGGRATVDGVVLHMPGRWQLVFDVRVGSRTERLTHDTTLR